MVVLFPSSGGGATPGGNTGVCVCARACLLSSLKKKAMKSSLYPCIRINKDLLKALNTSWCARKFKRCVRSGSCSTSEREGHDDSRYGKCDNTGKPRELRCRKGGKLTPGSLGGRFHTKGHI